MYILGYIGSMIIDREEFARKLRKNKKEEILRRKRFQVSEKNFTFSDESIKRLSECDQIFFNSEIPLVWLIIILSM